MTTSIPLDELSRWLARESASPRGDVAVLAGHFAIYSGGGVATDLLDGEMPITGAVAEMVAFTKLTWGAACDAAAILGEQAPRLVVLVDDIQFVRPTLAERSKEERLAAALASNYLDAVPQIPSYHLREMAARALPTNLILRESEVRWSFSERALRIAAVHHVRSELAAGRASDLASEDNGQTVTVTLPEHGGYCLVHSGRTTCAGGYIELLAALHARGIRKLIAMVPMRCVGPVGLGTVLARRLFPLAEIEVVNVAVPDPSLQLPAHAFTE